MKTVAQVSLRAAKAVLKRHHIDIPDAVIEEMLATTARPSNLYEVGDFIQYNEGMGETGFGVVTKRLGADSWTSYRVRCGDDQFDREISGSDVTSLSTPEAAAEYNRIRSGQ